MDKDFEIRSVLQSMGITPNKKGYSYIVNGVKIILDEFAQGRAFKQKFGICSLYTLIADIANEKPMTVERAIRYAIEKASEAGMNKMVELFPLSMKKPPSNGEFLGVLAEYIAYRK